MTTQVSATCQPPATTTRTLTDLDKIFTPSESCLGPTYNQAPYGSDSIERYPTTNVVVVSGTQGTATFTSAFTSDYVVRGRDPACFPSEFPSTTCYYSTVVSSAWSWTVSEQSYVYSPGRCPQNYVTAATSIDEDVTYGICCPE